jgi:hypothetical protein
MSKRERVKAQVRAPRAMEALVRATKRAANQSTSASVDQPARGRGLVTRPSGREQDKVTAYLPVELGGRLRAYCATERMELSVAMAEALEAYLASQS